MEVKAMKEPLDMADIMSREGGRALGQVAKQLRMIGDGGI